MADPEQFLRQIQQNAQSLATKAENKEVRQYRADQRHQHRMVNSHQAKLELQLRRMVQNELNRAVDEALKNAQPAAAKDPNGVLGKPQPLNPEQTPMVVTPVQPIPAVPPQKGALPSAMTKNLGTSDVEEGETKAGLLTQNQLVECRRLQAEAGSGISVVESGDYVKISTAPVGTPEDPAMVGSEETIFTDSDTDIWNITDEDQDGLDLKMLTRIAHEEGDYTEANGGTFIVKVYHTYVYFRRLKFNKNGNLISVTAESRTEVKALADIENIA